MHYPKITIITPSYNQGHYIEQTILSVLNQNYPNLEYIIMDGGSKDDTVRIIQKYADKLTYWLSEPDKGQSDAITKGLQIATGDLINWLNSDDYYEPNSLFKIAELAQKHPEALMIGGRSRIFFDSGETSHFSNGTDIYSNNLAKTIGWARIDQPETFFRKSAIDKMGAVDTDLRYVMDRDWWIKFLIYFGLDKCVKTDAVLVNFRLHQTSKTIAENTGFQRERDEYALAMGELLAWSDFNQVLLKLFPHLKPHRLKNFPSIKPDLLKASLNYFLLYLADEAYSLDKTKDCNEVLKVIEPSLLAAEDKKLYQKLKLRNSILSPQLKKWLRKLTRR
jgi:glycosyltransferase involved in cell wall biosynthesis